jgi:hypothetical protein
MMITTVTVHVEETTGEASDVGEENIKLLFPKGALPAAQVNQAFYATPFSAFGFIALSAVQGEGAQEVDLQETTGESYDPEELGFEAIAPKTVFPAGSLPVVGSDITAFSTGVAILLPIEEAPPEP